MAEVYDPYLPMTKEQLADRCRMLVRHSSNMEMLLYTALLKLAEAGDKDGIVKDAYEKYPFLAPDRESNDL